MKLLSWEQAILCRFIQANETQRKAISDDVKADPKSSGALMHALRVCSVF